MIFLYDLFFPTLFGCWVVQFLSSIVGIYFFKKSAWRLAYVPIFQKSKVSVAHFGLVTGAHLPFFRPNEGGGPLERSVANTSLEVKKSSPLKMYRNPNRKGLRFKKETSLFQG